MNSKIGGEFLFLDGFKFIPTDVQLLQSYLLPKLKGEKFPFEFIMDLDVYKYEPQQLAYINKFKETKDNQLFFFTREDESQNRTTPNGYWKVYDDNIAVARDNGKVIGYKTKKLFHDADGKPTEWEMTEFRCAIPTIVADASMKYIVCVIKPIKEGEEEEVFEIFTEDDEDEEYDEDDEDIDDE